MEDVVSRAVAHRPLHKREGYIFPRTLADVYGRGIWQADLFDRLGDQTAAVLVLLFQRDGDIHVLLTQRASKMRSHGGEIALPGGKSEVADGGVDAVTALREAEEEVGLGNAVTGLRVVCELDRLISAKGLLTTPVVRNTAAPHRAAPNANCHACCHATQTAKCTTSRVVRLTAALSGTALLHPLADGRLVAAGRLR
jgi:hypothetical protein